ncbi:MAG: hypothetical protein J5881_05185 [Clostridia bacterium]|nr:hypothetical protein [Clostridia bacterium]
MAGITINALTGSDSAPAKANEAKQKNDIGSAKEQLALLVQNAQLDAYDDIYVDNNKSVKATAATNTVGQRVINAALAQYGTAQQIGDATMQVTQSAVGQDAAVTITTRDFTQTGTISIDGGVLTWQPITENGGGQGNVDTGGPTVVGGIESVSIGDKVAYTPPADTTIANLDLPEGTTIENSLNYKADDIKDWVVLDVDTTTGEILIVPDTTSDDNSFVELTLDGMDGYNNAIAALNKVAEQYKNPTYAKEARSITVEDVNKLEERGPDYFTDEEKAELSVSEKWEHRYGMDTNLDIHDYGQTNGVDNVAERTYVITPSTAIIYYFINRSSGFLEGEYFWLASRCVSLYSSSCDFYVRCLEGGYVQGVEMFGVFRRRYLDRRRRRVGGRRRRIRSSCS